MQLFILHLFICINWSYCIWQKGGQKVIRFFRAWRQVLLFKATGLDTVRKPHDGASTREKFASVGAVDYMQLMLIIISEPAFKNIIWKSQNLGPHWACMNIQTERI